MKSLSFGFGEALAGCDDFLLGLSGTGPVIARHDFLARLQSLVLLEEVLDFSLVVLGNIFDILDVVETHIKFC